MKKFLILTAFLWAAIPAWSSDFSAVAPSGQTLYYHFNGNGGVCVSDANAGSISGHLIIPNSVVYNGNTYIVTCISQFAFQYCSGLTSVTIPNSVTYIGEMAFYDCSGLTSVTIGNSVTSIGNCAFSGCSGLTSVTIPNLVTSIGNGAFYGCSGLTSVTIPNSVTSIGNSAFYGCSGLTSVTIPNSVTSIGGSAFSGCIGLTSVTIGNSVTSIGNAAFSYCSGLTTVNFNAAYCTTAFVFSGCSNLSTVNIGNNVQYISGTFRNCSGLTSVTIGNSVTSIGDNAFSGCSGLTSVTIPNSVTSIGSDAFRGCIGLTSVTIGNSVTSIGNSAFYGCSGLTSVTIPNSVTSIGYYAFMSCSGLTSIVVSSGNTVYDSRNNCNAIIESATNKLLQGCRNTTIPNSVTSIGNYAFAGCSGLTSITIPNSVTGIGNYAFAGCSGLTSITIPNSVTGIGSYAFYACPGLTSITIPNSVTGIGSYAFYACPGLTSVTIGNSVTYIGDYAFAECSGLTSITIPNSVTYIGNYAFAGCSGLTSITIPNSVTGIDNYAFAGCSGLTSITIPNSVTGIGDGAFSGCSGLDSIVMLPLAPPYGISGSFLFSDNNALCYVRCGALAAYQAAAPDASARFVEMDFDGNLTLAVNDSLYGSAEIIPQNGQAVQCSDSSAVIQATAAPHYHFVHWSNGRTANPDTLYLEGDSTVTAIFAPDNPSICKVSVQDDRNVVFWNKEHEVEQFRIYREGAVAGDYELVATVPYSEPSVWTDEESRPGERRYSYKMTVVDAQGNESPFSEEHKTMHLTISRGTGNQWNLAWPEYRGAELESYMIYRGTEENDLQLIGQLPAGGAMSYTDEAAPAGTVYYQVAAVMSSPCDIAGSEPLIRSNIAVGEGEDSVGVRDVQAGNLQVWNAGGHIHVSLDGHEVAEYRVYDAIGREVYHATREARTPALPGGVYLVKVAGHPAHKVVVLW